MTQERLSGDSRNDRIVDRRVKRRALIAGTLATVTALGIGSTIGRDMFKDDRSTTAHDSDKPGNESRETKDRPIDDLIKLEYGGFAANGDPSLFIDVDQAMTIQLEATAGDVDGGEGESDVRFVVAQLPDGAHPTERTAFADTFIYGEDGTPYPTQTVDELTDDDGLFTLTIPLHSDTGSQHLYVVPVLVDEELTPTSLATANYLDIPVSFDGAGDLDLASLSGRD